MGKRIVILMFSLFALLAGSAVAADPPVAKGPFADTVHSTASVTYKDALTQSWTWDRGAITAVSTSSITLKRKDNQSVTFAITDKTAVRNNGASYTVDDLKVGDAATVISQSGNAVIIRNIKGDGAPAGGSASPIEGPAYQSVTGTVNAVYADGTTQSFDFNRGLITAASATSITIKRLDGQSVTLTVDSSTIVREKGQAGSADDLQVGYGGSFFSQNGVLKLAGCVKAARTGQGQGQGNARARQARSSHQGQGQQGQQVQSSTNGLQILSVSVR